MKKTKVLFAIWGILVIIIIVLLTSLGFILKSRLEDYQPIEEKLIQSAQEYARINVLFRDEVLEFVVHSNELIEQGYLKEEDLALDDDVCSGYVVIHNEGDVTYNAYLQCGKYETKGFDGDK